MVFLTAICGNLVENKFIWTKVRWRYTSVPLKNEATMALSYIFNY